MTRYKNFWLYVIATVCAFQGIANLDAVDEPGLTPELVREAILSGRLFVTVQDVWPEDHREGAIIVEENLRAHDASSTQAALLPLLNDDSPAVRIASAETLLELTSCIALSNDYVRMMLLDSSPEVNLVGLKISSEMQSNIELVCMIITDSHHPFREEAIDSLKPFLVAEIDAARRSVISLLGDSLNPDSLGAAVELLESVGMHGKFAEQSVTGLLVDEREYRLRWFSDVAPPHFINVAALQALRAIGDNSAQGAADLRRLIGRCEQRNHNRDFTDAEVLLWGEAALVMLVAQHDVEPIRSYLEAMEDRDRAALAPSTYFIGEAIRINPAAIRSWEKGAQFLDRLVDSPERRSVPQNWIVLGECPWAEEILNRRVRDYLSDPMDQTQCSCFGAVGALVARDGVTNWEANALAIAAIKCNSGRTQIKDVFFKLSRDGNAARKLRLALSAIHGRDDLDLRWKTELANELRSR